MKPRSGGVAAGLSLAFVGLVSIVSCNQILGNESPGYLREPVEGGPGGEGGVSACPEGSKTCGGRCAPLTDPLLGCAAEDCSACPLPGPTQTAICEGERCAVACLPFRFDCDGDPANGCETDLTRSATCGACKNRECFDGETCRVESGTPTCVVGCDDPLTLCTETVGDVTEDFCTDLGSDPMNCESCGHACTAPAGSYPTCGANGCGTCLVAQASCAGSCVISTDTQCGEYCEDCTAYTDEDFGDEHANGGTCQKGACVQLCDPGYVYEEDAEMCIAVAPQ